MGNRAQKIEESKASGGAIAIFIGNRSSDNHVIIETHNFTENYATWGGGVFVQFQRHAINNIVILRGGCFVGNNARRGGGGVGLGHISE